MSTLLQTSYSVIGNLSREADTNRMRCKSLSQSILDCKDECLSCRLKKELNFLEQRRVEILNIASCIKNLSKNDTLAIDFLIELSEVLRKLLVFTPGISVGY